MKKAALLIIMCMFISCVKKNDDILTVIAAYGGRVTINNHAITATGCAVHYGDLIETGDKSFCEMVINDKNILRLNQGSALVFNISGKDGSLDLKRGWLAGVTKKIFSEDRTYLINTPTVVASVRGTSFCTKVENPASTYFCVCNGKIELKNDSSEAGELVVSPHHTARRFKKGADGSIQVDKNPGLLYHKDSGIEEMAKIIKVKVDWTKAE
jgi:hypothetical protein